MDIMTINGSYCLYGAGCSDFEAAKIHNEDNLKGGAMLPETVLGPGFGPKTIEGCMVPPF